MLSAYQWRLNHSPLAGATNPTLLLTGVTPAQAGRYEVAVTGPGGAVMGASGTSYRLEHSWNLAPGGWNLLAPVTLGANRLFYVDAPDTNRFMRFYRAVPE